MSKSKEKDKHNLYENVGKYQKKIKVLAKLQKNIYNEVANKAKLQFKIN